MDERKDRADPARGGTFSSGVGNGLDGRGRDPVGRAGRFDRSSARYEADAICEYFDSQGGLRGAIQAGRKSGHRGRTFLFRIHTCWLWWRHLSCSQAVSLVV